MNAEAAHKARQYPARNHITVRCACGWEKRARNYDEAKRLQREHDRTPSGKGGPS